MKKSTAETIAYAIKKECQRSSLYDWCDSWDITTDEFDEFLALAVDNAEIEEKAHTCKCQHNSSSRDNEPCCRCDSRKTNADRIRNMSDEELMDTLFNNCLEYMHIDECPYADMNVGMCKKCISEWLQSEAEQERI